MDKNQTGLDLYKVKAEQKQLGTGLMAGGLIILIIGITPVIMIMTKGLIVLSGIVTIFFGIRKIIQGHSVSDRDVLLLAQELGQQITPEWIVLTFDVSVRDAKRIFERLRKADIIKQSYEVLLETGQTVGEVHVEENPLSAAKKRIRQQDTAE